MAAHNAPQDVKAFSLTTIFAFVVVFVFAMLMMLWHGSYTQDANGHINYNTRVNMPTDGNPDDE